MVRKILLVYTLLLAAFMSAQSTATITVRKPAVMPCMPSIQGKSGGNIQVAEISLMREIKVNGSCDYEIVSYVFSLSVNGVLKEFKYQGGIISSLTQAAMFSVKPGGKFFFEKIIAKDKASGRTITLPPLKYKVIQ